MKNDWLTADVPLIVAHRGASADAPENTLGAFSLALRQRADGIEFDVQLSADGFPVIIHDESVDRTTNGSGLVANMSVSQLQKLDAGQRQVIPRLSELFETFGARFLYNIELKGAFSPLAKLEKAVAALVVEHNLATRVLVSSFDPWVVRRAQFHLPPNTAVALIRDQAHRRYQRFIAGGQAEHPDRQLVNESYMLWAHHHHLRVHTWTVDDVAEAQRLCQLGVHAIMSNRPALIREGVASFLTTPPL